MKQQEKLEELREHLAILENLKNVIETLGVNQRAAEEVLEAGGTEADYNRRAIFIDEGEVIDAIRDIMRMQLAIQSDIEEIEAS